MKIFEKRGKSQSKVNEYKNPPSSAVKSTAECCSKAGIDGII
jgi:hypothetical protein